jgi:hypothetical protein
MEMFGIPALLDAGCGGGDDEAEVSACPEYVRIL